MKKVFFSAVFLLIIAVFGANAQNEQKTIFRIVEASIPDSVVFTMIEGEKLSTNVGISVYLISGEQSFNGKVSASGELDFSSTSGMFLNSKTKIIATDFEIPIDVKIIKIKFVAGNKVMYYDVVKKEWI